MQIQMQMQMATDTEASQEHCALRQMYFCDVCDKEYQTKGGLTRHMRSHVKPEVRECSRVKSRALHYCHRCGQNFKLADLSNHVCVSIETEGPLPCQLCSKVFMDKSTMRRHLLLHNNYPEHFVKQEPSEESGDEYNDSASGSKGGVSSPSRALAEGGPPQERESRSEVDVSGYGNGDVDPSGVSEPSERSSDKKNTKKSIHVQKQSGFSSQLRCTGTVSEQGNEDSGSKKRITPSQMSVITNGLFVIKGRKCALKKGIRQDNGKYSSKRQKTSEESSAMQVSDKPQQNDGTAYMGDSSSQQTNTARHAGVAAEPPEEQPFINSEANTWITHCHDSGPISCAVRATESGGKSSAGNVATNQQVSPESSEGSRQSTSAARGGEFPIPMAPPSEGERHLPQTPPVQRRTTHPSIKDDIDLERGAIVYQMKFFGSFTDQMTNAKTSLYSVDETKTAFRVFVPPSVTTGSAVSVEGSAQGYTKALSQNADDNSHSGVSHDEAHAAHSSDLANNYSNIVLRNNWDHGPHYYNCPGQSCSNGLLMGSVAQSNVPMTYYHPTQRSYMMPQIMLPDPLMHQQMMHQQMMHQQMMHQQMMHQQMMHQNMMHQNMMTQTVPQELPPGGFHAY